MASTKEFCEDPFKKNDLAIKQFRRMYKISELLFKQSEIKSLNKLNHILSNNSGFCELQRNLSTFEKIENMSSALSIVSKKLSEYDELQPQIISSFERIFDKNSTLILALENLMSFFERIDSNSVLSISKLSLNESFKYIDNLQKVLPELTSEAEKNTEIIISKENKAEEEKTSKKITKKDIDLYLKFIGILLRVIDILFCGILSNTPEINVNIGSDYSTNYYIQEVNNYYLKNEEFCCEEYNWNGYRFISEREVLIRSKPDCSSYVVQKLKLGKLVQVVDKYKKWVQIRWKNEDDTFSYGWIQNYKLSEFKE